MTTQSHTARDWFWAQDASGQNTALRERGSGDVILHPQADIGDYGLSVNCWTDVSDDHARLIAAAPDMLEALEAQESASEYAAQLSRLSEDGTRLTESHMARGRDLISTAKELRRAAIAKATGEAGQ